MAKDASSYDADISWDSAGTTALSGDALKILERLDRRIVDLAADFDPVAMYYPPIIPVWALNRTSYLESFPQHANFAVSLARSDDNLRNFLDGVKSGDGQHACLSDVSDVTHALTPAACYHVYYRHEGARLDGARYLTMKCNCFRAEDQYSPLKRHRVFTMREIVVLGTHGETTEFLDYMKMAVSRLADEIGITFDLIPATDPFFDAEKNPRALMQSLIPSKEEMVTPGNLAIGSFNSHRTFFGQSFDIRVNGEHAHSGCVAFGLERWLSAILEKHGPDTSNWSLLRGAGND